MKKLQKILCLLVAAVLCFSFAACADNNGDVIQSKFNISFEKDQYELKNGEAVKANQEKVTYSILGDTKGAEIDAKTGIVYFGTNVPDYTQIQVVAKLNSSTSLPVVCTLRQPDTTPLIAFKKANNFAVDGMTIITEVRPARAVVYEITPAVEGVSIDKYSGKLHIANTVEDGTLFSIKATAGTGAKTESFIAKTADMAVVDNAVQVCEKQMTRPLGFQFDNSRCPTAQFLGISNKAGSIDAKYYDFDQATQMLKILPNITEVLEIGENQLSINTSVNPINITIKMADKLISKAEQIAAINDSLEALSGYYIMINDIDLGDYLADNSKGWRAIGMYNEEDPSWTSPTQYAFMGVFDGNGHKITGYKLMRTTASNDSYNSGFFGITVGATIKNLGLEGSLHQSRSYSGTFIGANGGVIYNCYTTVATLLADSQDSDWPFKAIGGFAGRNEGTIMNCYSTTAVTSNEDYGAFVGINLGVLENCFALKSNATKLVGNGEAISGQLFENLSQMQSYDFNFGNEWTQAQNSLPKLVAQTQEYFLRDIEFVNLKEFYEYGEVFYIEPIIRPINAVDAGDVTVQVDCEDIVIDKQTDKFAINTAACSCQSVMFTVGCGQASAQTRVFLYAPLQQIEVVNQRNYVEAGKRYQLEAQILPANAKQDLSFELVSQVSGVTLEGSIIDISSTVADGAQIQVVAKNYKGTSSVVKTFTVVGFKRLSSAAAMQKDNITDAVFNLNNDGVSNVSGIRRAGKLIKTADYSIEAGVLTIKREAFDFIEGGMDIIIETTMPTVAVDEGIFVRYIGRIMIADVLITTPEQLIAISELTNDRQAYLARLGLTYALGCDINMQGAQMYAIGYYEDYKDGAETCFKGIFDGNGYTISNLTVVGISVNNETGELTTGTRNVGLFGFMGGIVQNLKVDNITVLGVGFVGGLVGSSVEGSHISNCYVSNVVLKTSAGDNTVPSSNAGAFIGTSRGTVTNCGWDGTSSTGQFYGRISSGSITGTYIA